MKKGYSVFDVVEHLKTEEDIRMYWEAVQEEAKDCPELLAPALSDIARARGIQKLADEVGMTRQGVYKALSPNGNPSFVSVVKIIHALGLKLTY